MSAGGFQLIQAIALFALAGVAIALGGLLVGWLLRPQRTTPDKAAAYECGEQAVGEGWVQFDLRFYVVALVFLVFDVEIALLYPWAVVFGGGGEAPAAGAEALGQVKWAATADVLFFVGVLFAGFLYLWRFGYLDWVRTVAGSTAAGMNQHELDSKQV